MQTVNTTTQKRDDYMEKTHKFIKAIILTVVTIIAIFAILIIVNIVSFLAERHVRNSRVLPIEYLDTNTKTYLQTI